ENSASVSHISRNACASSTGNSITFRLPILKSCGRKLNESLGHKKAQKARKEIINDLSDLVLFLRPLCLFVAECSLPTHNPFKLAGLWFEEIHGAGAFHRRLIGREDSGHAHLELVRIRR